MVTPTVTAAGIVATGLLLVCSAFFSSSETAIFSLPRETVERLAAGGDGRGETLAEITADPHRLLVTLLVGNNVVNIAVSSIVTVLVTGYLDAGPAIVVTTLLTSTVVLLFGEIVPKSYGLGNAESWALRVARPIRLVERVLSPLITAFDWVSRQLSRLISGETAIEEPYLD